MIFLIAGSHKITMIELLMKGGWLMYPLALLSLISFFILFERFFFLQGKRRRAISFFEKLRDLLSKGKVEDAIVLCQNTDSSESRILMKGLQNLGKPISDIRELMEMEGKLEVYKYEGNIYFLGVIAGIAPMMGFIGTISGVIKIFYNISLADNISISLISGGLYEKLITSGVGLSIGILAYISYHYLNSKLNKIIQQWEFCSVRFIDLINKGKS